MSFRKLNLMKGNYPMKNRLVFIIPLLIIFLSACSFSLAEDITPPPNYVSPTPQPTLGALYPSVPPSPARGKLLYEENCVACHGNNGLGNGPEAASLPVTIPAIGLQEIASQSNPADWYTVITRGRMEKDMPPYSSLSEAQRWDILAYVYTLSNTPAMAEQGSSLYKELCAPCHGPFGAGTQTPAKAVNFTDPVLMSQLTGVGMYQAVADGVAPDMHGFKSSLNDKEIWSVISYLWTSSYDTKTPAVVSATPTLEATATLENTVNPAGTSTFATQTTDLTGTPVAAGTQSPTVQTSPTSEVTPTTEAPTGTISGQVTNGSGGKLPQDLKITLHGFVNMTEKVTLDEKIRSDGSFEFSRVPLESGIAFIVSTEYSGTSYNSDVAVYDGTTVGYTLGLTVYDTTSDSSSITADRLHIFFDFSNPGLVQVIEIYILSNSSNKAVVPESKDKSVQTYTLPVSASNLQFDTGTIGSPYLKTNDGFGDPTTILPGASSYQLIYAFDMTYDKSLEIKQPLNVAVGSVVLMAQKGIKVKSTQLQDQGLKDVQGQSYTMLTSANLTAGDTLTFTISGAPKSTSTTSTSNNTSQTSLAVGLGILGAVLILAGLFFFLRGRNHRTFITDDLDQEPEGIDSLGENPDNLMDAIASLDDLFKAGTIGEKAYHARRDQLKARLKDLL